MLEKKFWKTPHLNKVYEALGAIADGRIEIDEAGVGKSYSSSRNKFYTISYDADSRAIMCNDNSSWFKGVLGYPSLAYLMKVGAIEFSSEYLDWLRDIPWKDINQKNKNDYDKTNAQAYEIVESRGGDSKALIKFAKEVIADIESQPYAHFGKKKFPPKGY